MITNSDLLEKTREQGEVAFNRFYATYQSEIQRYFYRQTGSKDDAEDLTQDFFIKVWNSKDRYQAKDQLKAWLYTVARNMVINNYRKRKALPNFLSIDTDGEAPQLSRDPESTCSLMIYQEKLDKIKQYLVGNEWEVFEERLKGATYDEIAEELCLPVGTVMSTLSRARENAIPALVSFSLKPQA